MELSQQCYALNANGLITMVSLTVLHPIKMGHRSVGMKHLFFIVTKSLPFLRFLFAFGSSSGDHSGNHAHLPVHLGKAWSLISNVLL
jgi:hypothetical protein